MVSACLDAQRSDGGTRFRWGLEARRWRSRGFWGRTRSSSRSTTRRRVVAATAFTPIAPTRINARRRRSRFSSRCSTCAARPIVRARRAPSRRRAPAPARGCFVTGTRGYEELFHRHEKNPILTAADWPYPAHSVFNPGATLLADGTTLLLCRVEDRRGLSHLCAARSKNGVDGWVIDPEPTLLPDSINLTPEELWGIEDPRITFVEELGKYAIAYTAFGKAGPGVALALTRDFRTFERCGLVMQPDDKDAALLPRRIDGSFALIHRPMTDSGGARVDVSVSGPSQLGDAQAGAPRAQGWVVGRQQDRPVASADRDAAGVAHALSRRPAERGRLPLQAGRRPARDRSAGSLPGSRGLVDLRSRETLRAGRRRRQRDASRADTPSARTATRCGSTTALPTRASRSPRGAFARSWPGCTSTAASPWAARPNAVRLAGSTTTTSHGLRAGAQRRVKRLGRGPVSAGEAPNWPQPNRFPRLLVSRGFGR